MVEHLTGYLEIASGENDVMNQCHLRYLVEYKMRSHDRISSNKRGHMNNVMLSNDDREVFVKRTHPAEDIWGNGVTVT